MKQKLTKLIVTKLSPAIYERFKEIAKNERRTLSALCRILIEDHIDVLDRNEEGT